MPGYMSVVASMPMSSPMISSMFGRGDLLPPGVAGFCAADTNATPAISKANTANPRNTIVMARLITVSFPHFVVIFDDVHLTAIPNGRTIRKINHNSEAWQMIGGYPPLSPDHQPLNIPSALRKTLRVKFGRDRPASKAVRRDAGALRGTALCRSEITCRSGFYNAE